mmetsp:Transcript_47685/g.103708  ORF Transcript_47685/g.103708 Transcript_47685/m.103708 type:complete len:324 (-) Transcript_47685:54-1025(-)
MSTVLQFLRDVASTFRNPFWLACCSHREGRLCWNLVTSRVAPTPSLAELQEAFSQWDAAELQALAQRCGRRIELPADKESLVEALAALLACERRLQLRVIDFCEICCEWLPVSSFRPLLCSHLPCKSCLSRFLSMEAEKMVENSRRHELCCYFPDCGVPIPNSVVAELCPDVVQLGKKLKQRERLMRRAQYPVLECPQSGCVGVAYDEPGRGTAMCFICEHSWTQGEQETDDLSDAKFSAFVRMCPKCLAPIERNGGCQQMRCVRCRRNFYWRRAPFANRTRQDEYDRQERDRRRAARAHRHRHGLHGHGRQARARSCIDCMG